MKVSLSLSMETKLDESGIKNALRGNPQSQADALRKTYDRYVAPLAAYIRERVAPTLDSHQLATAVNDVFIELAKKVKDGKLREDGSLKALLFTMARSNAIDQLRKKLRWTERRLPDHYTGAEGSAIGQGADFDEEFVARIAERLVRAPSLAVSWKALTQTRTAADETYANEVVRQFKMWLGTLPSLQRKVAETMAAYFGDVTNSEIADEIGKTDARPSVSSVKSARAQIREKFKSLIEDQERRL